MMAMFTCACGKRMIVRRDATPEGWTFNKRWRCETCSAGKVPR